MAAYINTNIASLNAQRNLNSSQGALQTSLQRLSSGLRINSAKDDAAGLAISDRMTSQIRGMNQAARNANDGISLAQTAEGALSEIGNNLQRIRELAVQSANATNSTSDRAALDAETSQLTAEISRVAGNASFNGVHLLDGTFQNQAFQVGANANETINISQIGDARASGLGSHTLSTTGTVMGTVVTGSTNNGIAAETDLTLTTANGSTTAPISYAANAGADAIASAINTAASSVGVTATATNSATLSGLSAAGTVSFTLNGQNISVAVANPTDLTDLAAAINGVSGSTGVTASFTSSTSKNSLTLSTSDGRNIGLSNFANSTVGNDSISFSGTTLTEGGTVTAVKTGTVALSSSKGAITTANANTDVFGAAVSNSSFSSLAGVSLTTASGAQNAISVIDAALASVNSSRADLGAIQNRFTSAVSNLQTTSENLSASRSRIQDTDFAAETATLTRGQILQQAGTAMLAQANSLPNGVLALLRG